ALVVDGLRGGVRLLVVALHDAWAAQQDLAVRGDLDLGARQRPAHGAVLVCGGPVDEARGAGLGEAVALGDEHAHGVEPAADVLVERCRAGDEEADAASEAFPDLAHDELVSQAVLELEHPRGLLALGTQLSGPVADALSPAEEL